MIYNNCIYSISSEGKKKIFWEKNLYRMTKKFWSNPTPEIADVHADTHHRQSIEYVCSSMCQPPLD